MVCRTGDGWFEDSERDKYITELKNERDYEEKSVNKNLL
jgi:hypothetical protein